MNQVAKPLAHASRVGVGQFPTGDAPSVTIAICTRDRPGDLRRAIVSVLRSDHTAFRLLVVDQSRDNRTRLIVERFARIDPRIRHVPCAGRGLSSARNLAMERAANDLVAFTDDDCRVDRRWLGSIVTAFRGDPTLGLIFGEASAAQDVDGDGFIVGYHISRRRRLRGRFAKRLDGGIGANMAVRRPAWQAVSGFDEVLGAGSYFPSCEDGDFAYRVLKSGYALLHLPDAEVTHYGLRDWQSGSHLIGNTYAAIAAAYFKHVRCGDLFAFFLIADQVLAALTNLLRRLLLRQPPFGFRRLVYLFVGIVRSFERGIDHRTCLYRTP